MAYYLIRQGLIRALFEQRYDSVDCGGLEMNAMKALTSEASKVSSPLAVGMVTSNTNNGHDPHVNMCYTAEPSKYRLHGD